MKSVNIIFPEKGKVQITEGDVPSPGPNEIVCATIKSLISTGTETLCLQGNIDPGTGWEEWVKYPFQPGYSTVARVLQAGENVKDLKPGDYVASDVPHQQYFTVEREWVHPLPEQIAAEDATWFSLARVAQQGVRRAKLELGETVGIVGMGMVGQLVLQFLLLAGCRKVICIDPVASRFGYAGDDNSVTFIAKDAASARADIEQLTNGKMLDVVFDVTGHPAVLAPASLLLRRLGRVILLGDTSTPSKQIVGPRIVTDSISILGIHGTMSPEHASEYNPWTRNEMDALFFEYAAQGRMNLERLVSHRVSPLDAARIYEQLLVNRNEYMGVIFDWEAL
ncbi:zinc-binding dehydrogenase [Paenibacillus sp. 481]|uniref:zinc-binding dehydrogenase n=1 Tax=Paenibacillus sp. 481 TaxID=2835869 RepID=UPI001E55C0BC|nr:zinc-binding alcohol dehydrogenase [Paenibacillus sp. 481]UHA73518.1 zinc-binding dehydrogenase [Paenibacillus sp. 481]